MQTRQHKMENSSQQASYSTAELNSYSSVATEAQPNMVTLKYKMCWVFKVSKLHVLLRQGELLFLKKLCYRHTKAIYIHLKNIYTT